MIDDPDCAVFRLDYSGIECPATEIVNKPIRFVSFRLKAVSQRCRDGLLQ
jgi:hypothetical protein